MRRIRRTADAARAAILAAAQRRLLAGGPDALRLQEIAADVGISHPAVLHHFRSREGLVEAVVEQTMRDMQAAFMHMPRLRDAAGTDLPARVERTAAYFEETHRVASDYGYARLLAWLALSRRDAQSLFDETFTAFPRAIHEQRVDRRRARGLPLPALEDTLFGTATIMFALIGEALFWDVLPRAMGLPAGRKVQRRYLRWLARLIEIYEPEPAETAGERAVPTGGRTRPRRRKQMPDGESAREAPRRKK
jgi:AcrR family transcriptional regulator